MQTPTRESLCRQHTPATKCKKKKGKHLRHLLDPLMTYNKLMAGVVYETIKINSSTQISSTPYNHVGARHQALDAAHWRRTAQSRNGRRPPAACGAGQSASHANSARTTVTRGGRGAASRLTGRPVPALALPVWLGAGVLPALCLGFLIRSLWIRRVPTAHTPCCGEQPS